MAFNFPNAVPKFPNAVKSERHDASPPAASHSGVHSQAGLDGHPLGALPREDQDLIVQLVLHSGSLKDLAATYDVSYPTIRNRLDRVIQRLRVIVEGRRPDELNELLSQLVEKGEISSETELQILGAIRKRVHDEVLNRRSTP